jgi:hypothetical protein
MFAVLLFETPNPILKIDAIKLLSWIIGLNLLRYALIFNEVAASRHFHPSIILASKTSGLTQLRSLTKLQSLVGEKGMTSLGNVFLTCTIPAQC